MILSAVNYDGVINFRKLDLVISLLVDTSYTVSFITKYLPLLREMCGYIQTQVRIVYAPHKLAIVLSLHWFDFLYCSITLR